jgi:flagellar biogenesis protein FliO
VLPAAVVRRRRQQTPLVVTMLLVFTIALLVLALIWVIRRNGSSPTAGPQSERIPIAVPTGRA